MTDLRPWIKIEGNTLYVFDKDGEEILYAIKVSTYTLKLFAEGILSNLGPITNTDHS